MLGSKQSHTNPSVHGMERHGSACHDAHRFCKQPASNYPRVLSRPTTSTHMLLHLHAVAVCPIAAAHVLLPFSLGSHTDKLSCVLQCAALRFM
jgi:hypothetical protein